MIMNNEEQDPIKEGLLDGLKDGLRFSSVGLLIAAGIYISTGGNYLEPLAGAMFCLSGFLFLDKFRKG